MKEIFYSVCRNNKNHCINEMYIMLIENLKIEVIPNSAIEKKIKCLIAKKKN